MATTRPAEEGRKRKGRGRKRRGGERKGVYASAAAGEFDARMRRDWVACGRERRTGRSRPIARRLGQCFEIQVVRIG
jgi:hypothetical protein